MLDDGVEERDEMENEQNEQNDITMRIKEMIRSKQDRDSEE